MVLCPRNCSPHPEISRNAALKRVFDFGHVRRSLRNPQEPNAPSRCETHIEKGRFVPATACQFPETQGKQPVRPWPLTSISVRDTETMRACSGRRGHDELLYRVENTAPRQLERSGQLSPASFVALGSHPRRQPASEEARRGDGPAGV